MCWVYLNFYNISCIKLKVNSKYLGNEKQLPVSHKISSNVVYYPAQTNQKHSEGGVFGFDDLGIDLNIKKIYYIKVSKSQEKRGDL